MLKIYLLSTDEPEYSNLNENILSRRRRDALARIKPQHARKLSVCAELALICAACEYAKENDICFTLPQDIGEDADGKPCFTEGSPFKERLYFSLSHSGSLAAAAVSDFPVGVDIEIIKKRPHMRPERILHPEEYGEFQKITGEDSRLKYFYDCWVCKEAVLKENGAGIRVRPSEFCFREGRISAPPEFFAAHSGLYGKTVQLLSENFSLPDGYCAAVCGKNVYELQNNIIYLYGKDLNLDQYL